MYKKFLVIFILIYAPLLLATTTKAAPNIELQQLVKADQDERKDFESNPTKLTLNTYNNDLKRRARVAEIFATIGFKAPDDYLAAALIFQHGNLPDHYYQAFIWSNRAYGLGDEAGKKLSALAMDRYLVSTGKKQLFGSQAYAPILGGCFCLQPTETSFPDDIRKQYTGMTLHDQYSWLASLNKGGHCANMNCKTNLAATPKGTIIGFW